MKIPESPKPFHELIGSIDNRQLAEKMVNSLSMSFDDSQYRHWDELRYRKPPHGFTRDEWWLALKIRRSGVVRRIPLTDVHGKHFTYALTDTVLRENEFASTNTAGHISLGEEVTNPATRDRYLVNSLMEEAITSSQLEGASTEKRVAKEMIRSGRAPRDRSERMIINNFRAMEFIGDNRNEELTTDLICELHRVVTEGTLKNPDAAGRFQLENEDRVAIYDNNDVLIYAPPPAGLLERRMQKLCEFANADQEGDYLPGVLRALILHFMLGYEHPFEDGNGRTARLLFYWSMLKQGYWLTEFISVSQILKKAPSKYGRSFLYTETDDNDLTYFLLYNLGVLHRAIEGLHSYLARKMAEVRDLKAKLRDDTDHFNSRQLALLHNALKNPGAMYSIQSHRLSHRVSAETARKDLVQLERSGLVDRQRRGKRFVYVPAMDIADKIKALNA